MKDDYSVKLAPGITIVSFLIILSLFFWETDYAELTTMQIFIVSLVSFLIGFASSFVVRLMGMETDYNISSIVVLVFGILLVLLIGDVQIGIVSTGSLLSVLVFSMAIGVGIGFVSYLVFR